MGVPRPAQAWGTSWRKIWVHGEKGDLVQVVYGTMGLPTATVRMRGAEEPGSARARALHGARFGFTRNTVTWYRWCMGQWGCRQRLCACGGRESLGQHGQGCFMVQDLGSRGIRWPCAGSVWDNGAADSDCAHAGGGRAWVSTGKGASWCKIWVHGEYGGLVQVVCGTMGLPTATVRMRGAGEPGSARARVLHGARFGFTGNTVALCR